MNWTLLYTCVLAALFVILIVLAVIWTLSVQNSYYFEEPVQLSEFNSREEPWRTVSMTREDDRQLKSILRRFHQLSKNYFLIGGTLLGSVRYQNRMPWDDDIDIAILDTWVPDFEALDFTSVNLKWERINFGYKIFDITENRSIENEEHFPFIDVFVYTSVDGRYVRKELYDAGIEDREFFDEHELFPLSQQRFGQHYYRAPQKTIPYLNRTYPNWDKVIIITHSHSQDLGGKRYQLIVNERNNAKIHDYLEHFP